MFNKMLGIILLIVILGVSGQLLIKKGMSEIGVIELSGANLIFKNIVKIISNPLVIAGLICSLIAAFFWLTALSRNDLNYLYPLIGGLVYVVLFISSWLLLGEKASSLRILGIATILVGLFLLYKSE